MHSKRLADDVDVIAPDGSEVRLLACGDHGSMAHFRLPAGKLSVAKQHREVEELWYFVAGHGEMCVGDEAIAVGPGISLRVPPRTRFQFASYGPDDLDAVAVTMPPWPGDDEAVDAEPFWETTIGGVITRA